MTTRAKPAACRPRSRFSQDRLADELSELRSQLEAERQEQRKTFAMLVKLVGKDALKTCLSGDDHEGAGLEDLVKEKRARQARRGYR